MLGSLQYRERCSSKYHESEARFYRTRIHGSCRCSDSEQHVISGSREGKMETLLCKNWTSGLRVCCNVRSRVLRPCHTYVVFSRLSLFLIYLLRGLTRVTYTTNKSHPCHSIVSLTRNNTTRMLRKYLTRASRSNTNTGTPRSR